VVVLLILDADGLLTYSYVMLHTHTHSLITRDEVASTILNVYK